MTNNKICIFILHTFLYTFREFMTLQVLILQCLKTQMHQKYFFMEHTNFICIIQKIMKYLAVKLTFWNLNVLKM